MLDEKEVRGFFDALHAGHFDRIEESLAEDVVFEFPGRRFGGRFEGRRKVMVFLKRNQRLFEGGLRFEIHWACVCGHRAIAQWTNQGRTRDGRDYTNRGVTIFRIESGRIAEIQDYLDTERISEFWPA
jgi:ketosteroid isomerase-like protein